MKVNNESDRLSERFDHVLTGYKWFSSAADGEIAITLAKMPGHKRVSCFGVETRRIRSNSSSNTESLGVTPNRSDNLFVSPKLDQVHPSIRIVRLKNKLGTKALPTAELELTGCPGVLLDGGW